jgi:ElaB/YqjD/DUF883 family membrane-anchored ribosome-binding protein
MTNRAAEKFDDVRSGAREQLGNAREQLGNVANRVAETGNHLRDEAQNRLADLGHRAQDFGHDARVRLQRAQVDAREFAADNPLAVGAVAIAAGVGVAMLLPSTDKENELIGPTRQCLLGDARETAERLSRAAKGAAHDVKAAIADNG